MLVVGVRALSPDLHESVLRIFASLGALFIGSNINYLRRTKMFSGSSWRLAGGALIPAGSDVERERRPVFLLKAEYCLSIRLIYDKGVLKVKMDKMNISV